MCNTGAVLALEFFLIKIGLFISTKKSIDHILIKFSTISFPGTFWIQAICCGQKQKDKKKKKDEKQIFTVPIVRSFLFTVSQLTVNVEIPSS